MRAFMEDGGFDLPIMLDPEAAVANRYGVTAVPTAVFLDAQGRVANLSVGALGVADLEAYVATVR